MERNHQGTCIPGVGIFDMAELQSNCLTAGEENTTRFAQRYVDSSNSHIFREERLSFLNLPKVQLEGQSPDDSNGLRGVVHVAYLPRNHFVSLQLGCPFNLQAITPNGNRGKKNAARVPAR